MSASRNQKFNLKNSLAFFATAAALLLASQSASSATPAAATLAKAQSAAAAAGATTAAKTEAKSEAKSEANSQASEITIGNFAFAPAVLTVKAGTRVTWINKDDIPHTVDSTQGKFKSAALDTDDKFDFLFTQPGEYPFFCRMHPKMIGKIIVAP